MPTATKYALIFAVLAGVGGVVCLVVAAKKGPRGIPPETPRTPLKQRPSSHVAVGGSQCS